jgi:cardiolipin synthase
MEDLWVAIAEFTASMHADRIAVVADAISVLSSVSEFDQAKHAFGPNADQTLTDRLYAAWQESASNSPKEIASAFRAAAQVASLMRSREALELVWTGPKTGLIPTRQTEQVMLEVIDSARSDLFLVTYVFYKVSSIVAALEAAVARRVAVSILVESSIEHGGTLHGDSVKSVRDAITGAKIYVWAQESKKLDGEPISAAVHAKCAVADRKLAFITSANLTTAALERNMELGMLIRGGTVPDRLGQHLAALVTTKVITEYR